MNTHYGIVESTTKYVTKSTKLVIEVQLYEEHNSASQQHKEGLCKSKTGAISHFVLVDLRESIIKIKHAGSKEDINDAIIPAMKSLYLGNAMIPQGQASKNLTSIN